MESIFDLPAHPLFVHAPIVLMPLMAGLALAVAVRPAWRSRFAVVVLLGGLALLVSTVMAAQSGGAFDRAIERAGQAIDVDRHQDLGETTRLIVILFSIALAATVGTAWLARSRRPPAARSAGAAARGTPPASLVYAGHVFAALSVLLGVLGTIWMIRTGHEGARIVWDGVIPTDG